MLSDWVGKHDYAEVEETLVGNNVPFGGIYTAADIANDPHYAARDNVVTVADEDLGEVTMPGIVPKMADTPGRILHAGPPIGHHNAEVYGGLLNMSEDTLADLAKDGVI
jgi:crotonobetainyl-CoA:carnitine CoA-transferase CaiB-like acyl-CoA transferase